MPRRMGELRRLLAEWNSLVPLAQERGIRHVGTMRVQAREYFHMDRVVARQRVADLRAQVAPFFAPNISAPVEQQASDTFGVELECYMPRGTTRSQLAQLIRDAGVLCQEEHYNHSTRTHWKVTTDGSLGYDYGVEIVSPPLSGEAGFDALRKVCQVLTRLRCKVNKSCGLHVHVGARHRSVANLKSLVRAYKHFELVIDSFLAPSRRGNSNQFCQSSHISNETNFDVATTVREVGLASGQYGFDHARSSGRYRKLNLMSFPGYGTVEFRQHQGTVEGRKAEMWVRFCLRMVASSSSMTHQEVVMRDNTFAGFASFLGLTQVEQDYFNERREEFASREQRRAA